MIRWDPPDEGGLGNGGGEEDTSQWKKTKIGQELTYTVHYTCNTFIAYASIFAQENPCKQFKPDVLMLCCSSFNDGWANF